MLVEQHKQWELPLSVRRVGWQPSRFLTDRAEAERAFAAARQRGGRAATPTLDPVFVALNPGVLPARERSPAELYQWVRREEQYATWTPT